VSHTLTTIDQQDPAPRVADSGHDRQFGRGPAK
jgi:hypothetical protein